MTRWNSALKTFNLGFHEAISESVVSMSAENMGRVMNGIIGACCLLAGGVGGLKMLADGSFQGLFFIIGGVVFSLMFFAAAREGHS